MGMDDGKALTIGEIADAAGVSRRAVRFYVQRQLIDPPTGLGRGGHYTSSHLEQLRRVRDLQAAGHSLDAIAQIIKSPAGDAPPVAGSAAPTLAQSPPFRGRGRGRRPAPLLSAELWTRLRLTDGAELNVNMARFNPTVEQLLALRQAARAILGLDELLPDAHDDHDSPAVDEPGPDRRP